MADPPPAGWYDDPGGTSGLRYWDGQNWTEHVSVPTAPTSARPRPTSSRARTAGIVLLVIVAAVVGYVVLGRLSSWFA